MNSGYRKALKNIRAYCNIADLLVLGHQGPDDVAMRLKAYHAPSFTSFIEYGLFKTANRLLGATVLNTEEWKIEGDIRSETLDRPLAVWGPILHLSVAGGLPKLISSSG
ncbi:hypothetical protein CEP52_005490 [Fusarium oligoseptatum]|uniref:Uncharacterized protein n=1 Tax=Fusarium oligoseptatum TaxID=2604345 RepID=A0A428TXV4_9HYPO|nr:hypothetical protein CEP52_005490 [Fusarium oligoseptatum]